MNKMKMESIDMTQYNIEKIAEMFPQVVTEVAVSEVDSSDHSPLTTDHSSDHSPLTTHHSKTRKAIDFEKLKLILSAGSGDYVVADDERERYEFTWVGKRQAMIDAATPIRKTLRPCVEESVNFDTTENIYIEGDNLEVLKLLQESYLGKVKMIYIDPPYNTGKDFVYKDNFKQSAEEYNEESGMYDEEDNKLFQNTETNGRFHSDWCSMIYPRLQLARNLLTDDGVIFISIDDNEVENLKKICDEVFGASNFVAQMVWQKKTGASDSANIATITEYIMVYSKTISLLQLNQNYEAHNKDRYRYKDEYFDVRGNFYYDSLDRGTLGYIESLDYAVIAPDGTNVFPNGRDTMLNDGWRWKWGKEKLTWGLQNGYIEVKENPAKENGWGVYYKIYENVDNEGNVTRRSSPYKNLISSVLNTHASSESKEIFGRTDYFSNPKPVKLLQYLVNIGAFKKDDIILDFFSGSATTAHAVMQLNAEDGGNRKFIMVQLPEETDEKSEARKAGYKNICEIGKERIRRAGDLIRNSQCVMRNSADASKNNLFENNYELSIKNYELDLGFRVFKLDSTNMKDVYYSAGAISQATLFGMESNIKEDRTDIDLLYGALLDWGVELTYPHTAEQIDGFTVHTVCEPMRNSECVMRNKADAKEKNNYELSITNSALLIACFDKNISEKAIREIASRKPLRALFRDHSFADSANKINVYEIFKAVAPDTSVRVI